MLALDTPDGFTDVTMHLLWCLSDGQDRSTNASGTQYTGQIEMEFELVNSKILLVMASHTIATSNPMVTKLIS